MGGREGTKLAWRDLWRALAAVAALGAVPLTACSTSVAGTAPVSDARGDAHGDDATPPTPGLGDGGDDLADGAGGGDLDAPDTTSFDALAPGDDAGDGLEASAGNDAGSATDAGDAAASSDASCTFVGSIAASLAASPVSQCPFSMCAAEVTACAADCVCSNAVTRALDCVGSQTGIAVTTTCFATNVVDVATDPPESDLGTCLVSRPCRDD